MSDNRKLSLWLVIAVALLTRLIYLFQFAGTPFYLVPMWDAGEYHDMAVALSRGEFHFAGPYRPPLYPLLLGVVYMLFGVGPLVPTLLQIAAGVYSCVLVQRIAARLFGQWAGLGAGLAAALSGMMIFYDLELMPTGLEVMLLLLLIDSLTRWEDRDQRTEIRDQRKWLRSSVVQSGLWFALGVLTRPTLLPLLPLFLLWGWLQKVGHKKLIAFACVALSSVAMSLIISLATGNGPLLTPAQGGVNFYIGNRQGADGFTATLPNVGAGWGWEIIEKLAEKDEGRDLKPRQVDKYYWKLGRKEVFADPVGWAKLMMRKGRLFWNRLEISNNRDIYYHAHRYPIIGWLLWIGFPLALPFALAGLWLGGRDRRVMLLGLVVICYAALVIAFFVNGRFRHPLTPILFILAAGGVAGLIAHVRALTLSSSTSSSLALALVLAIGSVSPFLSNPHIDPKRWDYGYFTEGTALERLGRTKEAEEYYGKALAANPTAPFVNFNLGEIAQARGDWRASESYYIRETEIQPHYGRAWNNLGLIYRALGDEITALRCFEQALAVRPDLDEAAVNIEISRKILGEQR